MAISYLLQENGNYLLQETGDKIILESDIFANFRMYVEKPDKSLSVERPVPLPGKIEFY